MEEDMPAIRIHLSYLNAMFGKLQHRWAVASGVAEGSGVSFNCFSSNACGMGTAKPGEARHKTAGVGWWWSDVA